MKMKNRYLITILTKPLKNLHYTLYSKRHTIKVFTM